MLFRKEGQPISSMSSAAGLCGVMGTGAIREAERGLTTVYKRRGGSYPREGVFYGRRGWKEEGAGARAGVATSLRRQTGRTCSWGS